MNLRMIIPSHALLTPIIACIDTCVNSTAVNIWPAFLCKYCSRSLGGQENSNSRGLISNNLLIACLIRRMQGYGELPARVQAAVAAVTGVKIIAVNEILTHVKRKKTRMGERAGLKRTGSGCVWPGWIDAAPVFRRRNERTDPPPPLDLMR